MVTTNITTDPATHFASTTQQTSAAPTLLVSLPPLDAEALEHVIALVSAALPQFPVLIATPDAPPALRAVNQQHTILNYIPQAPSLNSWTLTASDFLNAYELARKHGARAVLMLGAEVQSLDPAGLRRLADAMMDGQVDLAVPCYDLPPGAGLVNSAILYPVTRALFVARPRFPLAVDLGLSFRAVERLATVAQRFTVANQPEAIIWPVSELAVAGFNIVEVDVGPRALPQPSGRDFNSLLAEVAGSLFADIDSKAAYWQRARAPQAHRVRTASALSFAPLMAEDILPMVDAFRLAYGNLHEIWALVLPPQSLLGLKRMSVMAPQSFAMPDSLFARIIYDFLLAYRLRTINRGHLLGALTPLYLAWVASHLLQTIAGGDPERHIEATAAAFEVDKAYLVSRWRWPDRFNP